MTHSALTLSKNIIIIPEALNESKNLNGKVAIIEEEIRSIIQGERKYPSSLSFLKVIEDLSNNFNTSLKGCPIPFSPTLVGPSRLWVKPMSLRSNKVKNATIRKNDIRRMRVFRKRGKIRIDGQLKA